MKGARSKLSQAQKMNGYLLHHTSNSIVQAAKVMQQMAKAFNVPGNVFAPMGNHEQRAMYSRHCYGYYLQNRKMRIQCSLTCDIRQECKSKWNNDRKWLWLFVVSFVFNIISAGYYNSLWNAIPAGMHAVLFGTHVYEAYQRMAGALQAIETTARSREA